MPLLEPRTIPNVLTIGRVVLAPAIFFLILTPGFWPRFVAFGLYLVAAFSDLWDGYLARKHGWVTDFGKLMDPLADKLLLVAAFVPFYMISNRPGPLNDLPFWGQLPLWVLLVVFGRELLVTVIRTVEARRGRVLAAGGAGKLKAIFQHIFCAAAALWYALQSAAAARGWTGRVWEAWQGLVHGPVVAVSLGIAVFLTVYSMLVYFWQWRQPSFGRDA